MGHSAYTKGMHRISLKVEKQRTLQVSKVDGYLLTRLEAFLIDRKATGVAEGTLILLPPKNQAVFGLVRCPGHQAD